MSRCWFRNASLLGVNPQKMDFAIKSTCLSVFIHKVVAGVFRAVQNDVTVVDNNPDLVRRATETLDVQGIAGFASYPDVLDRAGAGDADMVIAATHSDEVNMVTCQVAHSVFGVTRKIARLRAQSYLEAIYRDLYKRDHMPIDVVISPEKEVAEAALQRIAAPSTFDAESFFEMLQWNI